MGGVCKLNIPMRHTNKVLEPQRVMKDFLTFAINCNFRFKGSAKKVLRLH